jgi:hypothetical protein
MPKPAVIGLKEATPDEITALINKYPNGCHVTHKRSGAKLPYNGVFYTQGKYSHGLGKWTRLR